jgi:hypothetical protein
MHSEFYGVKEKSPKHQTKASKNQQYLFLLVKMTKDEGKGKSVAALNFGPHREDVRLTVTSDRRIHELDFLIDLLHR